MPGAELSVGGAETRPPISRRSSQRSSPTVRPGSPPTERPGEVGVFDQTSESLGLELRAAQPFLGSHGEYLVERKTIDSDWIRVQ